MNEIIFYIVILLIFYLVSNLLIVSVFRRIYIRNAIRKNKLLLKRLREKNSEGNYHTYNSLLHNSLINLRKKFKEIPYSKLEDMVNREISKLSKNPILRLFDSLFLTFSSLLVLISLLFSLISGVLVIDEISIEETRKQYGNFHSNSNFIEFSGEEPYTKSNKNIYLKVRSYFHEKVYKEAKKYMEEIKEIVDAIFKSDSIAESYKNA